MLLKDYKKHIFESGDPLQHSKENVRKHFEGLEQVDKEFKEYCYKMMRAKDTKEAREEMYEMHRREFEQEPELEAWEMETHKQRKEGKAGVEKYAVDEVAKL